MIARFRFGILIATAVLSGCQSGYRDAAKKIDGHLLAGDMQGAAEVANGAFLAKKNERDAVVRAMDAGVTLLFAGRLQESSVALEDAYTRVRPLLDTNAEISLTENVGAIGANQTVMVYEGTPVERTMLNTFQAISKLAQGGYDEARVEFNRANEWQKDAVERYAKAIQSARQRAAKQAQSKGIDLAAASQSSDFSSLTTGLEDASAYASFQSPLTSYLRAIFLLSTSREAGDLGNARSELRSVYEMVPSARGVIEADLKQIDDGKFEPTTWVLVMSGMCPRRDEIRIDIPIPIGEVNYVSAAFPKLRSVDGNVDRYSIATADGVADTVELMNVESVVKAEFREALPAIIAQEIASSVAKAAATYALSNSSRDDTANLIGKIVGIAYQASTTQADLRSWRTLPKTIQVARASTPEDGKISVNAGDGQTIQVPVAADRFNVLLVWQPGGSGTPISMIQWSMNP